MATISSTAFFDALDHGCRPVVMADFDHPLQRQPCVRWQWRLEIPGGCGGSRCPRCRTALTRCCLAPVDGLRHRAGPADLIQTLRELKQNPPESLHETGGTSATPTSASPSCGAAPGGHPNSQLGRSQQPADAGEPDAPEAPQRGPTPVGGAMAQPTDRRLLVAITHRDVG